MDERREDEALGHSLEFFDTSKNRHECNAGSTNVYKRCDGAPRLVASFQGPAGCQTRFARAPQKNLQTLACHPRSTKCREHDQP